MHILTCFCDCVCIPGVVSCSQDQFSGSVLEKTVRPGDNITLYCDCKSSTRVFIVWYRNCSHENQPTLVLKTTKVILLKSTFNTTGPLQPFPPFQFVRNSSSESYDLLILNITNSDAGLYYCGTEELRDVDDKGFSDLTYVYGYGNVKTRIQVGKEFFFVCFFVVYEVSVSMNGF